MWLKKILIKNYITTYGLEDLRDLELDDMIEKSLRLRKLTTDLISHL